ncbi:MAG: hypothetical protein ABIZ49_00775 [Opitutaceae bacterium]
MIKFLVPAFYAVVAAAMLWLVALWLGTRLKMRRRHRAVKVLLGIATAILLFLPVDGVPIWNRAFSFYPNPSLPMLGIVCAALWQRMFGVPVFKPADWRATWVFGAVVGSALYLHPLLFGAIDLYYWGWERVNAAACLAGLAIVFLACGNRLGVLLLAALVAHAVDALESQNCWDYIMDPFFWLICTVMLGVRAVEWLAQRMRLRGERDILPGRAVALGVGAEPVEKPLASSRAA